MIKTGKYVCTPHTHRTPVLLNRQCDKQFTFSYPNNSDACRQFSELDNDVQEAFSKAMDATSIDWHYWQALASSCKSVTDRQASIELSYLRGDGRWVLRTLRSQE